MPTSSYATSAHPARPAHPATPSVPDRRRSDLILFMAIAFGVSWVSWSAAIGIGGEAMKSPAALPYLVGAFGPLTGALVIRVRRRRRGEPVPEHAVRFRRSTLFWAPLLLVLASASVLSAALLAHEAGGPALSWEGAKDVMNDMGGPAAFLVSMVISGPLSEEPGWRGTAYPRMRASMGRLQVGLVLGAIWAVWHLPLFFIDGTPQKELGLNTPGGVLFAVSTIPMAMLTASAYERAGVVASIAVHFAVNTTMVLLDVKAPVTQAMIIGIQAIVAVLLLATSRPASGPAPTAPATPADGAVRA
ncbi:CPBP family intramembrane glutamic endopeptidase [Streptomyces sp. S465]|uniref:CPBP family intramembrane glutamic endopeptidase n=1 Tax=Streptomyces sp. S465 TaxID=2979468 RepID=UPI0022A82C83|nr:type II CAAX endopeptidase family protein [Streptomyces sp. S465]WAP56976.1 type II CAAX endopeptidase family protein [Streptomyces sp. S465]